MAWRPPSRLPTVIDQRSAILITAASANHGRTQDPGFADAAARAAVVAGAKSVRLLVPRSTDPATALDGEGGRVLVVDGHRIVDSETEDWTLALLQRAHAGNMKVIGSLPDVKALRDYGARHRVGPGRRSALAIGLGRVIQFARPDVLVADESVVASISNDARGHGFLRYVDAFVALRDGRPVMIHDRFGRDFPVSAVRPQATEAPAGPGAFAGALAAAWAGGETVISDLVRSASRSASGQDVIVSEAVHGRDSLSAGPNLGS